MMGLDEACALAEMLEWNVHHGGYTGLSQLDRWATCPASALSMWRVLKADAAWRKMTPAAAAAKYLDPFIRPKYPTWLQVGWGWTFADAATYLRGRRDAARG